MTGSTTAADFDWRDHDGALFDLDGVITPTAEIHERAWAELFEPWGFTSADYLAHVDGRPRYDGVATFLASRDVELPWGEAQSVAETLLCLGMLSRQRERLPAGSVRLGELRVKVGDLRGAADAAARARQSSTA